MSIDQPSINPSVHVQKLGISIYNALGPFLISYYSGFFKKKKTSQEKKTPQAITHSTFTEVTFL